MRARAAALQWLVRLSALALWVLVLWGGLLLLVTLIDAAGEGLRPALARLLPSPGASAWAWINALSAALAIGVGIVTAGVLSLGRRNRARPLDKSISK